MRIARSTTFRAAYQDGMPLWKVIKKAGSNVWLCESQIEYTKGGLQLDYGGIRKSFLTSEIAAAINLELFFTKTKSKHEEFYQNLIDGQIVHYNNGFDQWVRCKAVNHELQPIALCGNWKEYDLPKRDFKTGEIIHSYYSRKIAENETFTPHAGNLFEVGNKPRDGIDPNTLPAIDLTVPELNEEQWKTVVLWTYVNKVRNIGGNCPWDILLEMRENINQALSIPRQLRNLRML